MIDNRYSFEIVSMTTGKAYKVFDIDGDKTIGVDKGDKFKLRVKNNTYSKIQVRLSVDGTDVLSGEPASTSTYGKMFVLSPKGLDNSILELEAWPEDDEGGAAFVFGDTEKGVAINTHKRTEGIGRLAVAIFEESYSRPFRHNSRSSLDSRINARMTRGNSYSANVDCDPGIMPCSATMDAAPVAAPASTTMDFMEQSYERSVEEETVSVGAGEHVEQKITKTAGLSRPKFAKTIELKYETWNVLKSKLSQFEEAPPKKATAFPGNREKFADLSSVPRQ